MERLTEAFVEQIFAAIRATPLTEIRSDLQAVGARRSVPPPPSLRATEGPRSVPPKSVRGRASEILDDDGVDNVITNPEALLRAAFGDGASAPAEPEATSRVKELLTTPSSRPPASLRVSTAEASSLPVAAEPRAASSASRVLRRRRT